MDGAAAADANERLLVVGATNRPQELDEAARRRLQKRLMIPLPDGEARTQMLHRGLDGISGGHTLTPEEIARVVAETDGYSGSDMAGLCREAAMEPLRDEGMRERLLNEAPGSAGSGLRAVAVGDFEAALCQVRPSVSPSELQGFEDWNKSFGSFHGRKNV